MSIVKEDRDRKIEELYQHHSSYFESKGMILNKDFKYAPKLFHYKKGRAEEGKVIGFFKSEFQAGLDIYLEKVNSNWDSEDKNRGLYLFKFNPHYEEEYEKDSLGRYLVPVDEVDKVDTTVVKKKITVKEIKSIDDDCKLDEMTLKDYAAIHMKIPCSNKEWLNNIIKTYE